MLKQPLSADDKLKIHLREIEDDIQSQFELAKITVSSTAAELPERLKAARFIWLMTGMPEDKRRMIELLMQHESLLSK